MAPQKAKEAAARAAKKGSNSDDEGSPQKRKRGEKELGESITAHSGLPSVIDQIAHVYHILSGISKTTNHPKDNADQEGEVTTKKKAKKVGIDLSDGINKKRVSD